VLGNSSVVVAYEQLAGRAVFEGVACYPLVGERVVEFFYADIADVSHNRCKITHKRGKMSKFAQKERIDYG